MTNKEAMDKVIDVLKSKDNFLITSHINPEGDSIGSQLAVHHILKKLGKNAVMVNHDSVPDNLRFLPEVGLIMPDVPEDFDAEVIIILDCPVKERTGKVHKYIKDDQTVVNIDHHVSNELFGDINWVEPETSSVGEMIFGLIKRMNLDIDKEIAASIYAAIVTDTGVFTYDNTSPKTHQIAAELMVAGVNPKTLHDEIFEKKSVHEIRLLGKALTTLQIAGEGKIAYISLTTEMLKEEGVDYISTDEFINFPRSIKSVEVALFFKEYDSADGKVNVSFRSVSEIDVNAVASRFGGGGHPRAAGCVLECGLEEAQEKVLEKVQKALEGGE